MSAAPFNVSNVTFKSSADKPLQHYLMDTGGFSTASSGCWASPSGLSCVDGVGGYCFGFQRPQLNIRLSKIAFQSLTIYHWPIMVSWLFLNSQKRCRNWAFHADFVYWRICIFQLWYNLSDEVVTVTVGFAYQFTGVAIRWKHQSDRNRQLMWVYFMRHDNSWLRYKSYEHCCNSITQFTTLVSKAPYRWIFSYWCDHPYLSCFLKYQKHPCVTVTDFSHRLLHYRSAGLRQPRWYW